MIGRRYDLTEWSWPEADGPRLWDYGKQPDGTWYGVTPAGVAGLNKHQVIEHTDGTVTVSPSILVGIGILDPTQSQPSWHGYLEHSVWREV